MTPPDAPDLFSAAGLVLEPTPPRKPRKAKRPRKPTPAERAAAARALGARRAACPCDDGVRARVGEPRVFHKPKVVGFLFSRNAQLVEETKQLLPDLYSREYDKIRAKIHRSISQKFIRRGIPNDDASWCAHELIHAAFNIKMAETRKEMAAR